MQLLKRIFDFYVFGNIHVALATFSLTKITLLFMGVTENRMPLFVFFATLLSYNFIRLVRKSEIKSWFQNWINTHISALYVLCFVSVLGLIYLAPQLHRHTLLLLVPLALLTLFYAVPFRGKRSLRALSGLKLFLIAFCWAAVTVALPVINYEFAFSKELLLIFIQRIVFVAAITIPFDIRDVDFDLESLRTVPQVFGIAKAKRIGMFMLMLFVGLNFLKDSPSSMLTIEFVVMLTALLLLVRANREQGNYYSAFLVEAIPIFWLVLILMK